MKAVFDTRPVTSYDDDVTHRYHFPDRYLEAAQRTDGDWAVLREPTLLVATNGAVELRARTAAEQGGVRIVDRSDIVALCAVARSLLEAA